MTEPEKVAPAVHVAPGAAQGDSTPHDGKKKKKKKKKMKYSAGLALYQQYFRAANKAGRSISSSINAYWSEWDRRWDSSARKRRNGGLIDAARNEGQALSRMLETASRGPVRYSRALPRIRKLTLLRLLFPPLWFTR